MHPSRTNDGLDQPSFTAQDCASNPLGLLVFHGTRERFDQFAHDYIGTRTDDGAAFLGFFFSESRDVAKFFTDPEDEIIVVARLRVTNPVRLTADEFELKYAELDREEAEAQRSAWVAAGYDGVRIEAGGGMIDHEATVWIAFEPSQIEIQNKLDLVGSHKRKLRLGR